MNQHLQSILNFIQQEGKLSANEKNILSNSVKEAANQLEQKTKIIETQHRELEIEAALERVRVRAMAMQKSDELTEVASVLFQQLQRLGLSNLRRSAVSIMNEAATAWECWYTSLLGDSFAHAMQMPMRGHEAAEGVTLAWQKKEIFSGEYSGEKLKELMEFLITNGWIYAPGDTPPTKFVLTGVPFAQGLIIAFTSEQLSLTEIEIIQRFGRVFEQTYTRFLDLQKAEAQTREAQIEIALEKVRSRSLEMFDTKELQEVVTVVFEKLQELGITLDSGGAIITIFIKDSKDVIQWIASPDLLSSSSYYVSWFEHPILADLWNARESGLDFFSKAYSVEEKNSLFKFFFEYTDYKYFPEEYKKWILQNEKYSISGAWSSHSAILIPSHAGTLPSAEQINILKRFSRVFEQAYVRFLDLQKSEAQAREVQIELALERVRARAMAMQKSDDLAEAVAIVFDELDNLDLEMLRCGIGIINKEKRIADVWSTTKADNNTTVQVAGDELVDIHPLLKGGYEAWVEGKKEFSYALMGEDLNNYYKALQGANFRLPESQSLTSGTEGMQQYYYCAMFSAGGLHAFRETEFSEEAKFVLRRFAEVFNLTYTRFNDLKKAEAQARKALIEASLERVRSSSLAMHKSDELKEVVKVVSENLRSLGIKKMDSVNINIFHEGAKDFDLWIAAPGQDYTRNFRLPYLDHPIANDFFDSVNRGEILHKKVYGFGEKNEYFKYMFENSDNKYLPEERKELILNGAGYSVSAAIAKHSSIFMHNYSGAYFSDEDNEILVSFSKVFDQAYNRYLDLHKAELLVKDALKQASLDRIRGQVSSMRSTEDLQKIIPFIWQELGKLGIPFMRCGVFIIDEEKAFMQAYLSTPNGQSLGVLHLPISGDELTNKTVDHWRRKKVFRHHWDQVDFLKWMQTLIDQGQVESMETFRQGTLPPDSLELHFIPFTHGMLYVGSIQPLTQYEFDLVQSLADAFSVAYARYDDFIKLEKAKENIEKTLTELKAAQSQLIQAEKMASLGQLTAGVAHEIKNPLNFVNNFSEVNAELIAEMKEEIDKGNLEAVKSIANDIADNEQKINHHGKRADAIIKGMLQHSRGSTGTKEPTDINALADEYLRLAFHGLRAKDKTFNATMKTDFDKSIGNINIIPQDIGRAILNLITNAFYAVTEKKKQAAENYEPTVSVSTKKIRNKLEVKVADNGNGIPQKIIEKIFQPFFTTKPTGQGTGLGLSLSYDIVKAHGGELKVVTKEGEGSEFIIQLSIV